MGGSGAESVALQEARWYQKLEAHKVRCQLCAHGCQIADGKLGICDVRVNHAGVLYSLTYGKVITQNADPIEKKPLFHVLPGSLAYSIATVGCNFRCTFCQNSDISQMPRARGMIPGSQTPPEQIVAGARQARCASIAYTYTEPTIFSEYAADIARLAHTAGLLNIYVTNGYMTPQLLDDLHPVLDAANVDLKSFRDEFYREQCGARLQPVLDTLRHMKRLGIWIEITTLLIPGINDDPAELCELAGFIAHDLGPETPWHISRFFPRYQLTDRAPTSLPALTRASEIGRQAGLRYVYMGNVPGDGETTRCHHCDEPLIERYGYQIVSNNLEHGHCPRCQAPLAGIGLKSPAAH